MLYNFIILWSFEPQDLLLPCYMNPLNPSNIIGLVASFLPVFLHCVLLIEMVKLLIHRWSLSSLGRWTAWQLRSVISSVLERQAPKKKKKSHSLLTGSGLVQGRELLIWCWWVGGWREECAELKRESKNLEIKKNSILTHFLKANFFLLWWIGNLRLVDANFYVKVKVA